MNIGILTFHKAHNYGALLQSIALRQAIIRLGHNVSYIDYWPEFHDSEYKFFNKFLFRRFSLLRKINYLRKLAIGGTKIKKRIHVFKEFIDEYIDPFCTNISTQSEFDAIVYGSDQIWRKQCDGRYEFDKTFFGLHEFKTIRNVSYAASMGIIDCNEEDKLFITTSLKKFNKIGVREKDLKELLESYGLQGIKQCLDPTLLISKEQWIDLLKIPFDNRKSYVLFYDLIQGSFDINFVKQFAEEKGLQLIVLKASVNNYNYGVRTIDDASPKEFISLIANAEYVFTSSFHGLAFSIIFEKQFYAAYKNNGSRALTLLEALGLENRLFGNNGNISVKENIDYNIVRKKLTELKKDSIDFLSAALK